jgi:hypothetical protein
MKLRYAGMLLKVSMALSAAEYVFSPNFCAFRPRAAGRRRVGPRVKTGPGKLVISSLSD